LKSEDKGKISKNKVICSQGLSLRFLHLPMMTAILATNKKSLIQQWHVCWVLGTRFWSTMESGFQMNESFVNAG
jgi:hypothetical protein